MTVICNVPILMYLFYVQYQYLGFHKIIIIQEAKNDVSYQNYLFDYVEMYRQGRKGGSRAGSSRPSKHRMPQQFFINVLICIIFVYSSNKIMSIILNMLLQVGGKG